VSVPYVVVVPDPGLDPDPADPVGRVPLEPKRLVKPLGTDPV
jgi:hypothetical protein